MRIFAQTFALAGQVLGILLLLSPRQTSEVFQLPWILHPVTGRLLGFIVLFSSFAVFNQLSRGPGSSEEQTSGDLRRLAAALEASDARESVVRLLVEGRKIEAIKGVRSALGCGLKEAKDLVEEIAEKTNAL